MIKKIIFIFMFLTMFFKSYAGIIDSVYDNTTGFIDIPVNIAATEDLVKLFESINPINIYLNNKTEENFTIAKNKTTDVLIYFYQQDKNDFISEMNDGMLRGASLMYLFLLEKIHSDVSYNIAVNNVMAELGSISVLTSTPDWVNPNYNKDLSKSLSRGFIVPRMMGNFQPTVPTITEAFKIADAFFAYNFPSKGDFIKAIRKCDLVMRKRTLIEDIIPDIASVYGNLSPVEKRNVFDSFIIAEKIENEDLTDSEIAQKTFDDLTTAGVTEKEFYKMGYRIISNALTGQLVNPEKFAVYHEITTIDFTKKDILKIQVRFALKTGFRRNILATTYNSLDTPTASLITSMITELQNRNETNLSALNPYQIKAVMKDRDFLFAFLIEAVNKVENPTNLGTRIKNIINNNNIVVSAEDKTSTVNAALSICEFRGLSAARISQIRTALGVSG